LAKEPSHVYALDDVLSPEAKEALRHLELFARRRAEGFMLGTHPSKRVGVSAEFDHHKDYQPGDPLKHVDWKASARHDRYYVKRYLEDTALSVRLVVDRSASMLQASGGPSKYLHACRVAACLAYLVLKQGDLVGLVLTSADGTRWVPASSKGTHLVTILGELVARDAAAQDNVPKCLRTILDRGERKGLVVLVSDLMYDPAPVQSELGKLQAQGHEVLLVQLRDPTEEDFPFNRWVQFHDLESPSVTHRIDTIPLAKIYREEYQALMEDWRRWAKRYDIHFVTFRTDEHVEKALSEYVAFRVRATK